MSDQEIHEARMIALAAPVLLPMLARRRRIAQEKMISAFRNGETNYLTLVAEISTIDAIERDITSKEQSLQGKGE